MQTSLKRILKYELAHSTINQILKEEGLTRKEETGAKIIEK